MGRLDRLSLALGHGAAWLFVVAAAITVYEVAMRYLLDAPTTWVHVSTTALCAIGFCFGGAYAMARDQHVRITSLIEHTSVRTQHSSRVLGLACGVLYLGGLAYATLLQAHESVWRFEAGRRWVPEAVPGPPHWPLPAATRVALAAGTLLFLAAVVVRLWREITRRAVAGDESAAP